MFEAICILCDKTITTNLLNYNYAFNQCLDCQVEYAVGVDSATIHVEEDRILKYIWAFYAFVNQTSFSLYTPIDVNTYSFDGFIPYKIAKEKALLRHLFS